MQQAQLIQAITDAVNRVPKIDCAQSKQQIVLAYSGGVDSEVLAFGLSQFAQQNPQYQYMFVYVHHGLSDNADDWQQHCVQRAKHYQIDFNVARVKLELNKGDSIESQARDKRYAALEALMSKGDILLTAHHQDDQLETLLLALARGLGPKGLASMSTLQPFKGDKYIVRPMLAFSRADIEAFSCRYGLKHIEDESNFDSRFDRNFLRHEIIPLLKSRWPSYAVTVSRSAALCAEQQQTLDEQVHRLLPQLLSSSRYSQYPIFDLEKLMEYSQAMRTQLLRGYLHHCQLPTLSRAQTEQVLEQLIFAKTDANVHFKAEGIAIRRFQQFAYVERQVDSSTLAQSSSALLTKLKREIQATKEKHSQIEKAESSGGLENALTHSANQESSLLLCPKMRLPEDLELLTVKYRLAGSYRCQPHYRNKGRELKKVLQELAVPPWVRCRVPYLFYGAQLVAAIGLWVEKPFVAKDGELSIQFDTDKLR
ncbi:tRNA lysidine(34) synthetase TilS [Shewanella gelidii]|uniref:tRNA(Ile)-lysidine synthase n=1 Tax=Shewanella gelidii TaxID=1642821 RepID=A0A917JLW0_9GAMM|nr:tRNA lysidine(34) synthetase TilS [Shewanella gelidii]MCL1097329.1 tRNA lysidine(34) synthetase TilS [Shewanella gelidii]GGI74273.1 tRNA(Ile)-lysidine synthase [Shewanella gelidii]